VATAAHSPIQFLRFRSEIDSFESIAALRRASANLTEVGLPETLGALRITAEFFETLKINPQLGRWFTRAEEKRGMPNLVVISDFLWRRRFSADPNILGRKIILA